MNQFTVHPSSRFTDKALKPILRDFLEHADKQPILSALHKFPVPNLEVMKDEYGGHMLACKAPIAAGTIVYFTHGGILVNPTPNEGRCYLGTTLHLDVSGSGKMRNIEAVHTLGKGYYFNHSCNEPNLDLNTLNVKVDKKGLIQVILFTTNSDVPAGTQLTFNYYKGVPSCSRKFVVRRTPEKGFTKCLCSKECRNYIHHALPVHPDSVI